MKEPSKNTGKIITKIKINKNKVVIYFSNDKIEISKEAYLSVYLYVGKVLNDKEINELKRFDGLDKLLKYALNLLKQRHYSEWRMREKLHLKSEDEILINRTIKILKEQDLIDDDAFIADYLEYANEQLIGKNKIKQKLLEKGIFKERVDKISFSEAKEKAKAKKLMPIYENRYQNLAYENKKRHIYQALISQGFDYGSAQYALQFMKPANEKNEKEKIKSDYKKALNQYKSRYEGKELKEKIFNKLKSKGYRTKDILLVLGDYSYDD